MLRDDRRAFQAGCLKLTFAKGAALDDPSGLFNASLDGSLKRAIDLREGNAIEEAALVALFRRRPARNVRPLDAQAGTLDVEPPWQPWNETACAAQRVFVGVIATGE